MNNYAVATKSQITRLEKDLSARAGTEVSELYLHPDGITCTVSTELGAYKVAHYYQESRATVKPIGDTGLWGVSIYQEMTIISPAE